MNLKAIQKQSIIWCIALRSCVISGQKNDIALKQTMQMAVERKAEAGGRNHAAGEKADQ